MNTIRELKQQEKYHNMLKRKNKEKNIYKSKNSTLRIEKMNLIKAVERKNKEIERLNNIINDIDRYIHNWRLKDIGEKTMLILNDILLIKNGMSDEVIRLKGEDKE